MEIIYLASLDSIHTRRWINFFAEINYSKIFCISFKENKEKINKNIRVYQLNGLLFFKNFFKAIFLLRSRKNCIVHVHYLGWNSLLLLFTNKDQKIILTPWGCDLYENKNNLLKRLWLKFILFKCDFIICDSRKLLKAAIEIGFKKKKAEIIAFGTDTYKYKSYKKPFKNKNNNNEIIKIGTNRNMENIYDPLTLLKSANYLRRKSKNFKFYIANDGSLRSSLKKYIKVNKLKTTIKLIGKKHGKENIDFYNSIDIYVSTSLRDGGLSASIAEAMACERIVIVSDNSDNSKYIKHGISGYLFKNKDYKQLANLIEIASKNKSGSLEIASEARKIIIDKCNYHKEMEKVKNIYLKFSRSV